MIYHTTIIDGDEKVHEVDVYYQWIPVKPETFDSPCEGDVEILGHVCHTKLLSAAECEQVRKECAKEVWDSYHG